MPVYEYGCQNDECGLGKFELMFKSLPSEDLQAEAKCPLCMKKAPRLMSMFNVNNASSFGVQKDVSMAMKKAPDGTPLYRDENGQIRDVRTAADVDKWMKNNQLGPPRMVEYRNPVTGEKSWVPQRTVMKSDPTTGELLDAGTTVRESANMVQLDDNFNMPTVSKSGRPMENGVLKKTGTLKSRLIDPETGQRVTFDNMWGSGEMINAVPKHGPRTREALSNNGNSQRRIIK